MQRGFNMFNQIKLCSGTTLRKTCKHDGSKARYFAYIEDSTGTGFRRISKALYEQLQSLARSKCAFTTKVLKDTVQYQHSISI